MTSREFFKTVVEMREAQKFYSKTRSRRALNDSKELEQKIDEEIERVKRIMANRYKPKTLFEQEGIE